MLFSLMIKRIWFLNPDWVVLFCEFFLNWLKNFYSPKRLKYKKRKQSDDIICHCRLVSSSVTIKKNWTLCISEWIIFRPNCQSYLIFPITSYEIITNFSLIFLSFYQWKNKFRNKNGQNFYVLYWKQCKNGESLTEFCFYEKRLTSCLSISKNIILMEIRLWPQWQ